MERKDRRATGGTSGHRGGPVCCCASSHASRGIQLCRLEARRPRRREFTPSAELKTLYREVAKRVHPDLATDEADHRKREQLMAEANAAYQRGDAETLRRILEEYECSPESVQGAGVAADLVRVIRQIRQVRGRLSQIEIEIATLIDSDIAKLRAKAEAANPEGRDLLTEMAEKVRKRIAVARRKFEADSVAEANA